MEVVLDTNVLVSGLLYSNSPPGEIIDLVFGNSITPVFDDRIMYEYREVLMRPRFAFSPLVIEELLRSFIAIGRHTIAPRTRLKLPDEKDRCFYECALSTMTKILITGNKKHFPAHTCSDITVLLPLEFLAL